MNEASICCGLDGFFYANCVCRGNFSPQNPPKKVILKNSVSVHSVVSSEAGGKKKTAEPLFSRHSAYFVVERCFSAHLVHRIRRKHRNCHCVAVYWPPPASSMCCIGYLANGTRRNSKKSKEFSAFSVFSVVNKKNSCASTRVTRTFGPRISTRRSGTRQPPCRTVLRAVFLHMRAG
jgi:hypothetical protein